MGGFTAWGRATPEAPGHPCTGARVVSSQAAVGGWSLSTWQGGGAWLSGGWAGVWQSQDSLTLTES